MFSNTNCGAAALTGITSSTLSYWKGASHQLALGSYLLLYRERAHVKAIARQEQLWSRISMIDRQTDKLTDRQTDSQTHRLTDRQIDTQTHRHTDKQTNRNSQTHSQTHRLTDRQIDRQTGREE